MENMMDKIVSLCKRRGFIFQSSDIYGGIQGFWDYGPLGTELKRNVREAWYRDMVTNHDEISVPTGAASVSDGRPRKLDHHAPASLEVLRALRFVPRHDGGLQEMQDAFSE